MAGTTRQWRDRQSAGPPHISASWHLDCKAVPYPQVRDPCDDSMSLQQAGPGHPSSCRTDCLPLELAALTAPCVSFLGPTPSFKCVLDGDDPASSTLVGDVRSMLLAVDGNSMLSTLLLELLDTQVQRNGMHAHACTCMRMLVLVLMPQFSPLPPVPPLPFPRNASTHVTLGCRSVRLGPATRGAPCFLGCCCAACTPSCPTACLKLQCCTARAMRCLLARRRLSMRRCPWRSFRRCWASIAWQTTGRVWRA